MSMRGSTTAPILLFASVYYQLFNFWWVNCIREDNMPKSLLLLLVFCLVSPLYSGTVTDIDGNTYQTIKIGNQWWMAENLKAIHYRNGDSIPTVTDNSTWRFLATGAYCEYNNDVNNVAIYGRLYNWYAVADSRNIAPAGWHVASDAEWKQLEMTLGMSQAQADSIDWRGTTEGGKLKEVGTIHWSTPNTGATNESGFSALPGGYRYSGNGTYDYVGYSAYFWSSTEHVSGTAWSRRLSYYYSGLGRNGYYKEFGFSVRCVRDNYVCGDANSDATVNVGDVVFLINYIFKLSAPPRPLDAGDSNCNQVVNVGDVVYLINYVFKLTAAPCCP
jgi:uncharacterized protein (TIGR02145 family)